VTGLARGGTLTAACDHKQHDAGKAAEIIALRRAADFRPRSEIDWKAEKCWRCKTYRIVTVRGEDAISPEVRALVLARDRFCCVCCGTPIAGEHYSLGHRVRASQGGRPVASNLITLLGLGGELHHGRIDGRTDPHDEGKGYALFSWQDPAEVGVMYFERPDGPGVTFWLTDDGRRLTEAERAAA
jgi:hypothetical protein